MSLMGVKGLKIRTCIERRFNYSKDITDRSETSMQKQNSDKYQLREILFVHNNAIAMKPALLKKQTNKQKNIFNDEPQPPSHNSTGIQWYSYIERISIATYP